jgi:hypothetical protein
MSYPPISDKSNQIWTFASATDLREMEWAVEHQGDGCFIIDPVVAQNGLTHLVAKRCDDKGVPCVIAYTDGRDDMSKVDMARLDRVLAMTDKIALTTSHINEWSPIHPVSHWTDFAKSKGFQWCCAYIHVRLLEDLKAKVVQEQLLRPCWRGARRRPAGGLLRAPDRVLRRRGPEGHRPRDSTVDGSVRAQRHRGGRAAGAVRAGRSADHVLQDGLPRSGRPDLDMKPRRQAC